MPEEKAAKAKKKSKKQLAAELELQREQARLAEEQDLKRLEASELERRKAEAAARVESERRREEDALKLQQEREASLSAFEERADRVHTILAADDAEREWVASLANSPLPSAADESALNTFLTLWREQEDTNDNAGAGFDPLGLRVIDGAGRAASGGAVASGKPANIAATLSLCAQAERLADELADLEAVAKETGDTERAAWCAEFRRVFRDTERRKIEKMTARVLKYADEFERVLDMEEPASGPASPSASTAAEAKGGGLKGDKALRDELKREVCESHFTPSVRFGLWVHASTRHFRRKSVAFDSIGVTVDLPKSVAMLKAPLALRVLQFAYDHVSRASDESPLVSVGGVLALQQLAIPPAPRKVKGWTVRDLGGEADQQPVVVPYSNGGASSGIAGAQPQPFRVTFGVAPSVFLPDGAVQVGWWDEQRQGWRQDGLSDVRVNREANTITLSTVHLAPLAIIQPRALDFPYREWRLEVQARGQETATLALLGSRFEVRIDVRGRLCSLAAPDFAFLRGQWLPPGRLLAALARSGINLLPSDSDARFARKTLRKVAVERAAHDAVASLLPVCEVRSSTWNHSRSADECVFEFRCLNRSAAAPSEGKHADSKEASEPAAGKPFPWHTVLAGDNSLLPVAASPERFSAEPAAPSLFSHCSMGPLLADLHGDDAALLEALAAAGTEHLGFQVTVRSLLNLVRPFVFN